MLNLVFLKNEKFLYAQKKLEWASFLSKSKWIDTYITSPVKQ